MQSGQLGKIYAADLVFHNAYGPDKAWFYDPKLSGGGCVIDLGIHLVDFALWTMNFPKVEMVTSRLFAGGEALVGQDKVEDYAVARLDLSNGSTVQLSCSWKVHAGCDAIIAATFYGTHGGIAFCNVGGSFYDFSTQRFYGTKRETIIQPPDVWGGRAAVNWARQLSVDSRFDPAIEQSVEVARVLDRIYGR